MVNKNKLAIIWVWYIWLALLEAYINKWFNIIWFDISISRIDYLKSKYKDSNVIFTYDEALLQWCDFYFICVNTWFTDSWPDLQSVIKATELVAKNIKKWSCIIYESTLLPWTIDNKIIPRISEITNFVIDSDYYVWFSPERINPWDTIHWISSINKVIACNSEAWLSLIKEIYSYIYPITNLVTAKSILHAEFSKVIENTQRYINIQFINELSISLDSYWVNIYDVLTLCATKWNYLDFKPWFVSWSCIPLASQYLNFSFKESWNKNSIILTSGLIQKDFENFISKKIFNHIKIKQTPLKILFLWITYKKNVSFFSPHYYMYLYKELGENNTVHIYDPHIFNKNIQELMDFWFQRESLLGKLEWEYDLICYFVDHIEYQQMNFNRNLNSWWYFFDITWRFSDRDFENFISI